MKGIFWSLVFFLSSVAITAQTTFSVTPKIKDAYRLISDLKLDSAELLINQIIEKEPENYLVYLIENYIDFYRIFILEQKDLLRDLEKNKNARIAQIRKGDEKNPFYLFSEAEINIQWAIARLKFDQKMMAARELYRAYSLLEENKKRFPEFPYNNKSLSFIHVMAQSIPGIIRSILNIEGSIKKGTHEIEELYKWSIEQEEDLFHDEITIIYAYILFYQNNQKKKAWEVLEKKYLDTEITSPIILFVVSNMAQKLGKTDLAIDLLTNRVRHTDAIPFDYLQLLLGKWKLYRLDWDSNIALKNFVSSFSGQHYLKEAYQKLAWYHLVVQDDVAGYKKYMNLLQKVGNTLVDEDKQAAQEAKKGPIPHPALLKGRLLFDGGYYQRSQSLLVRKAHLFSAPRDLLEYNYRMGRVAQELKNFPEALSYYRLTMESKNEKSFMLCNAALQSALILEKQKREKQALSFLDKCLSLKPSKYRSSIHQKAKAARERIKNK